MCNNCQLNNRETSIAELHVHSDYSNLVTRDSTNKVDALLSKAVELNRVGLALTDHETISGHVKISQAYSKMKKSDKIPEDFKLMLGNEIYLVDSLENVRDNYEGGGVTRFPHFLMIAKDAKGHQMIRELSSQAWKQSFVTGIMRRRPTTEQQLSDKLEGNQGHLFGTSACLGSQSSIYILNDEYEKAKEYNLWCESIFGKGYFFLEIQPATSEEQIIVNKALVQIHEETGIPLVVTSDVHYLRPEDAEVHSAFLNSEEGVDRETEKFYAHTYMHTFDEMYEKMSYLPQEYINQAIQNTVKISEQCESYSLESPTEIPRINLEEDSFELLHMFENYYEQFPYIKNMAFSDEIQDRYLLHKVEVGFIEKRPRNTLSKDKLLQILVALNNEMRELWEMSKNMNQAMSAYYVTTAKLVELIWGDDYCSPEETFEKGSLVGVGRGSAGAWEINYLLGITQISPLDFEGVVIPHWRLVK